jgi:hypothetical protein
MAADDRGLEDSSRNGVIRRWPPMGTDMKGRIRTSEGYPQIAADLEKRGRDARQFQKRERSLSNPR